MSRLGVAVVAVVGVFWFMLVIPSTRYGGFFFGSVAVTAVSWHPFSSVLASVDRNKQCIVWADT